jgi:Holliday junction resolvase RusA-like endonuclease
MHEVITFSVLGTPVAKGTAIISKHGKFAHLRSPEKTVNAERTLLAQALPHKPDTPWEGPIGIKVKCVFARPKCHYRTGKNSHLLRDDAPELHIVKPDASNLLKMVEDALKEVFFKDDSQIVMPIPYKVYGDVPRIEITIYKIELSDIENMEFWTKK